MTVSAGAAQVAAFLAERAETRKLSDGAGLGGGERGRGALGRADPTKTPLVPDTTRCGPRRPGPRPSRRE